jgi:hypothetical protein
MGGQMVVLILLILACSTALAISDCSINKATHIVSRSECGYVRQVTLRSMRSPRRRQGEGLWRLVPRLLPLGWFMFALSQAEAHDIRADADLANDWIEGLVNGENDPCCGSNDCYPLRSGSLQASPDGTFMVEVDGDWVLVPSHHLLRDRSPDGRAWACPQREPTGAGFSYTVRGIRCLLLPRMM